MYTELSKTIRGYGDPYAFDKSDWARSDALNFEWLQPCPNLDGEAKRDKEMKPLVRYRLSLPIMRHGDAQQENVLLFVSRRIQALIHPSPRPLPTPFTY